MTAIVERIEMIPPCEKRATLTADEARPPAAMAAG